MICLVHIVKTAEHSCIYRVNELAKDFCTNSWFYSTKKGKNFGTLNVSRG